MIKIEHDPNTGKPFYYLACECCGEMIPWDEKAFCTYKGWVCKECLIDSVTKCDPETLVKEYENELEYPF